MDRCKAWPLGFLAVFPETLTDGPSFVPTMSRSNHVIGLFALAMTASVQATNVYKIPIRNRAATGVNVPATDWFNRGDNEV